MGFWNSMGDNHLVNEDKVKFDEYNKYIDKIEREIKASKTKKMDRSAFSKLDDDINFERGKFLSALKSLKKVVQNESKV